MGVGARENVKPEIFVRKSQDSRFTFLRILVSVCHDSLLSEMLISQYLRGAAAPFKVT